jgi:hypothetical protein
MALFLRIKGTDREKFDLKENQLIGRAFGMRDSASPVH